MVKEWPNPANNFDFFVDAALFDAHRWCKAKGSRARVDALLAALPFYATVFFSRFYDKINGGPNQRIWIVNTVWETGSTCFFSFLCNANMHLR
jgi:hypothetical protein